MGNSNALITSEKTDDVKLRGDGGSGPGPVSDDSESSNPLKSQARWEGFAHSRGSLCGAWSRCRKIEERDLFRRLPARSLVLRVVNRWPGLAKSGQAAETGTASALCSALAGGLVPDTTLTEVAQVAAREDLPLFFQVEARVAGRVALVMPLRAMGWDGKFKGPPRVRGGAFCRVRGRC